jgi:hypothetical protein
MSPNRMKYRNDAAGPNKQQSYIPAGVKDATQPQVKKFKPSEYNKVNPASTAPSMNASRYNTVKSAASPKRPKRYEG